MFFSVCRKAWMPLNYTYIRCREQMSGYRQIQTCVARVVLRVQLIVKKYFLGTRLGCYSVLMRYRVSVSHLSFRSCSYGILI